MIPLQVRELGEVPYLEAWELQKGLAAERAADRIPDTLLLLEHPHTYTFGRSGQRSNLLWSEAECAARGIALHWVDRGGDITYHGPGQIVGYPILKLGTPDAANGRLPHTDYVGYMRSLEEMLIRVLLRHGIVAGQLSGITGVFVQPDVASRCPHCPPSARLSPSKIAQIGVKVDARGVSQHGFALNAAPDMTYFEGIIGCGLRDHAPISMADLLPEPPGLEAVRGTIVEEFARIMERAIVT